MTSLPPADAKPKRPSRVSRVLWIALAVVAAVAAWQAYLFYSAPPARLVPPDIDVGAHGGDPGRSPYAATASAPASAPASPMGVLGEEGLRPLQGHPLSIDPPAGSRKIGGFQRPRGREIHQQASYSAPMAPDAVAAHYRGRLQGLGYKLAKDSSGRDGVRMLIFLDEHQSRAVLAFGPASGRGGEFTLTVIAAK